MTSVAEAFAAVPGRAGLVVGIIPCSSGDAAVPKRGYPNPFVELAIMTHLPLSGADGTDDRSRNHINVLTSDVLVALPGGAGTGSEVALAVRYGRPSPPTSTTAPKFRTSLPTFRFSLHLWKCRRLYSVASRLGP